MLVELPSRRALAAASAFSFGGVFVLFLFVERPGLGLGHLYYFAIALAALAGGRRLGIAAGLLAACLYTAGVIINPLIPSHTAVTEGALLRAVTYVGIGALIGWFSARHRQLVAELRILADRDELTGLPSSRVFETAIARRIERGQPFLLALAWFDVDLDAPGMGDKLRSAADGLLSNVAREDEVARIADNEFALLTGNATATPGDLAGRLEFALSTAIPAVSVGWSVFPRDGGNALALYRAANERLYVRRVFRGQSGGDTRQQDPFEPIALDIRD